MPCIRVLEGSTSRFQVSMHKNKNTILFPKAELVGLSVEPQLIMAILHAPSKLWLVEIIWKNRMKSQWNTVHSYFDDVCDAEANLFSHLGLQRRGARHRPVSLHHGQFWLM